jgi:hypothetical protein
VPSINSQTLALTTTGDDTTITVTYNAVFSEFERQLAGIGMGFHAHTEVVGVDPGAVTAVLAIFPRAAFAVSSGRGPLIVPTTEEMVVPRATLQEDPGGDDEIRVQIRIHSVGLPPTFTEEIFTERERLLG